MSDAATQEGASGEGTSESTETGSATSGTPQGFVPEAELERERQRTRSFQAERDRLAAELAKARDAGESQDTGKGKDGQGLDLDEFRRSVLRDAFHATSMARAAETLRTEFPHADEGLFTPDRITEFGSVEAFKFAVEDSHKRVDSILAKERTSLEEKIRQEMAEKYGISTTTSSTGDGSAPSGDPTPEALSRMSESEWEALEAKSPGVIDRVLMKAANAG